MNYTTQSDHAYWLVRKARVFSTVHMLYSGSHLLYLTSLTCDDYFKEPSYNVRKVIHSS